MQLDSRLIEKWKDLQKLKDKYRNININSLFREDEYRAERYKTEFNGLILDYSRNFINSEIFDCLISYLDKINLSEKISQLMSGEVVNTTENKPSLHCFLRDLNNKEAISNLEHIENNYLKISNYIAKENITNIVNIGIGGSHLGPELLYTSMKSFLSNKVKCYFVSNIDPENIYQVLNNITPENTIFLISSKSFTTDETITNYKIAKSWVMSSYSNSEEIKNRFYAITVDKNKALEQGFDENNIILFNENIGGRYSITSSIAMPFILTNEFDSFKKFISGASAIDKHFSSTNFSNNIPVILALLDFWYINFYHINNRAIVPYSYNLRLLPKHLQQLTMESLGKSIDNNLNKILYCTSNLIWGEMGTDIQHSCFQMLHQGTNIIPCDFIIPLEPSIQGIKEVESAHKKLIYNAFSQIEVLVSGTKSEFKYKDISGNKPCNVILFDKINPEIVGMIIAMYEQKVFTLSNIWNINCFDQFGVEKGKDLAKKYLSKALS